MSEMMQTCGQHGSLEHGPSQQEPVNAETAVQLADEFVAKLSPYPGSRYAGRGIVIPAGGVTYNTCAWVTIRMLRRLGCRLPIQVWYNGAEECDRSWHELVRPYDVQCVDAQELARTHPHRDLTGWAIKPYALLHAPFREVLLLDADNVPVRDPTYLFDEADYQRTGAMFWPDGNATPRERSCWQLFGVDYRDELAQESGQVLVDKAQCWQALSLCNWYNEHSYFYWNIVYGDKDTFRFAWHRVKQPFAMTPHRLVMIPYTLCQHDHQGRRVFQHRAHMKWSLRNNPPSHGFWYEDECLGFLDDLRNRWNPLADLTEHLGDDDRRQMAELTGQTVECHCLGYRPRKLALGPENRIRDGRILEMCRWWCESGQLVLADKDGRWQCKLHPDEDGVWKGRPRGAKRNWRPVRFR